MDKFDDLDMANQTTPEIIQLTKTIRKVPDYPKPGILFYDITPLFINPKVFQFIIKQLSQWVEKAIKNSNVNKIIGIEARGFLLSAPIAQQLCMPLVLARKKNKLPGATWKKTFDSEYSNETVEIQKTDIQKKDNVIIIDDLIATGGTLKAVLEIAKDVNARVHSLASIITLDFLDYKKQLKGSKIFRIINFEENK